MADEGNLRTRRWRAHKAGDHRLCKACKALRAEPPPMVPIGDPMDEMRLLAGQLASACRADPGNAVLARELRMTLQALSGGRLDGELAEFLAGFGRA